MELIFVVSKYMRNAETKQGKTLQKKSYCYKLFDEKSFLCSQFSQQNFLFLHLNA